MDSRYIEHLKEKVALLEQEERRVDDARAEASHQHYIAQKTWYALCDKQDLVHLRLVCAQNDLAKAMPA